MCMIKEYDPSPILPLIKSGTRLPLICVYTEFRATQGFKKYTKSFHRHKLWPFLLLADGHFLNSANQSYNGIYCNTMEFITISLHFCIIEEKAKVDNVCESSLFPLNSKTTAKLTT